MLCARTLYILIAAGALIAGAILLGRTDVARPEEDTLAIPDIADMEESGVPAQFSLPEENAPPENADAEEPQSFPPPAREVTAEGAKRDYIVRYTNSGFVPESIMVPRGATVIFINDNDRIPLWVASDRHPMHTLYPERSDADCLGSFFDACGWTRPGEEWSFTFHHQGHWGYHNHQQEIHLGHVVVEEL